MPEGKKNTAPVPAPVRDEDGYSAKTHLHQPVQETATVAATALLADAPEGALPSEVRPEIVTWEKLCEAMQASGKAYNMEMIQKAYELANNAHKGVCRRSGEPYICVFSWRIIPVCHLPCWRDTDACIPAPFIGASCWASGCRQRDGSMTSSRSPWRRQYQRASLSAMWSPAITAR